MTTTDQQIATPTPLGALPDQAESVMVPMRDGVRLSTDVYLPKGTGPFPTILTRSPYDKTSRYLAIPWVAAYFVDRGYAFVAQDVRGKARSEGLAVPFVNEVSDGWDTLEWVADQRFCAGSVGMWGESYYGFTQWAAVASGHPALCAVVPRNTYTLYGQEHFYRQGVGELSSPVSWVIQAWMDNRLYEPHIDWGIRPLVDLVPEAPRQRTIDRWRAADPSDPFWTTGIFGIPSPPRRIRVPALHLGGWWDFFQRPQLLDWATARVSSTAPQFLVMDATDHYLAEWTMEPKGAVDFGICSDAELEAALPAYLDEPIAFYDRYLAGRARAELAPVRWRLTNDGWQTSDSWPPPGAQSLTLHLAAPDRALEGPEGGALSRIADSEPRSVRWPHDPSEPVPSILLNERHPLGTPPDDRELERRPDVLTFTSDPVDAPLDLSGPAAADLTVGSSGPSMHVMTKLLVVAPDGSTRRLLQGAALVRDPSDDRRVVVDLGSTGFRVLPGHRLRLELSSSDFPHHVLHPGTDDDPWTATTYRVNEQRLLVGGGRGSQLRLTVAPA
jgi:predicted acyl esterase